MVAQNLHDTTTFFNGRFDAYNVTVVVCCALALYNALALLLLIFTTFRKYKGLYFWSLVIASSGVIPYTVGFMVGYFKATSQVAYLVITSYGWPAMVTGQSLVLYSRLGVVLGKGYRNLLRAVWWMIVVDGIVFHVTTIVVLFGAYYAPPRYHFSEAYRYVEKIQMTGFTIQEFIISGLYVWRTLDILKATGPARKRKRRVMWQLFAISVLIIILDLALLVVEYQNRHVIEQALKEVVYSVKLLLEFAILSKLVGMTRPASATNLTALEHEVDAFDPDGRRSSNNALLAENGAAGWRQGSKSSAALHLERVSSTLTDGYDGMHDVGIKPVLRPQSVRTLEEQGRRRTLDEDLYAGACRNLAT